MIQKFYRQVIYFFWESKVAPIFVSIFFGFSCGLMTASIFILPLFSNQTNKNEFTPEISEGIPDGAKLHSLESKIKYIPSKFDDLPGWNKDNITEVLPLLQLSCNQLTKGINKNKQLQLIKLTSQDWKSACLALSKLKDSDNLKFRSVLTNYFVPYLVETQSGQYGIFTGYYEVRLKGSLVPTNNYTYPIYSLPQDLITIDNDDFNLLNSNNPLLVGQINNNKLVPYDTRYEIESNKLFSKRADVLVWVDDVVDVFLLHIQGSGIVEFPNGTVKRIGYAGNNGKRFKGIGSILLKAGELRKGESSMPYIANWLRDNPEKAQRYMAQNPRYIFFQWNKGLGPTGAFGIPLVSQRSLAIDPSYIPYGAPIWIDTKDPDGNNIKKLVVALDTGSAIRGAIRGDFYWGTGDKAFHVAGRMKSQGRYFVLLPKNLNL